MRFKHLLCGVSGLVLVAAATSAASQTQQAAPTTVGAVVVTATKRATSLEKIPASISALSGAEIAERGTQDLAQIVELTPGVNLTTPADNADRITIRGIASEVNTNPTAGMFYGDISLQDAWVPHATLDPNPFDMADVEVLKGPQGTLFGASALNGAIRYVPQGPNMTTFGGKFYAQGSTVSEGGDGGSVGAVLNVPIIKDDLSLRLVFDDTAIPGWVDNLRTGQKASNRGAQNGERAILEWKPTDRFDATLTYNRQALGFKDYPDVGNLNGQLSVDDRPRASPLTEVYDLTSLRMNYDVGAFTIVSDTGYVHKQYNEFGEGSNNAIPGASPPLAATVSNQHSDSYSQEFRLVSNDTPASKWSWVVGAFASQQNIVQDGEYQLGGPGQSPLATAGLLNTVLAPGIGSLWLALGQPDLEDGTANVTVKELSGFFNVTRKLGDGFDFTLGGRVYQTSSGGRIDTSGLELDYSGYVTTGIPTGNQLVNATVKDTGFNPSASLTWRPNNDFMLYTTVSKGYRIGGPQPAVSGLFGTQAAPSTFKTDTIWNYEVGLRSRMFDNTLQFDLTGFYEKWTDPQLYVFILGGFGGSYVDNVGGVNSEGVETSLQYHAPFLPGLTLKGSATYDDAYTTTNFSTSVGGPGLAKGAAWPLSPKWQTAVTLSYDHSLENWAWGGYVTDAYLDRADYGVGQPTPVFGYSQVDAQIHFRAPELPLRPELAFTVANIADTRGISTAYSGQYYTGATWNEVTYIQPRTFTVRISGSF